MNHGTPDRQKVASNGLLCVVMLLLLVLQAAEARAIDTVFNSGTELRSEFSRLGGEGKLYLTSPVVDYLPQTLAAAGLFALSYHFDRDIRSDLDANRSTGLRRATNVGSIVGDPYIHLGLAAALYGAGALADKPKVMRVGEELGEALALTDATTFLLKQGGGRGRPTVSQDNSSYRPFQFKKDFDSLPSMHTASSFAVAHVLASETDSIPVKALCYTGATFVGFSRLYQGKHWSSDVVLAAALGELAGTAVTRYRAATPGKVTIAPTFNDGVPALALVGKF